MSATCYVCNACGENIVIVPSAECIQNYYEDCLVCCRANVIHIEIAPLLIHAYVWIPAIDRERWRVAICVS